MTEHLLSLRGVGVRFALPGAQVAAVTDLWLDLHAGELLAVVGESGCGKSVLAHALLGLLPRNASVTGRAFLQTPGGSTDLLTLTEKDRVRSVRGRLVGLVPQSPATALTPVRTGRAQLEETLRAHGSTRRAAGGRADVLAESVGLTPDDLEAFPHELSGGMAQRLVTALALAGNPPLLLADEPTSGLDRPLVDATLDLLRARCDEGAAVMLITHDLAAAERVADTVAVMYASRIVEHGPAGTVLDQPAHPYAAGLLDALPSRQFRVVPGDPPALSALPAGCAFAPRCARADVACAVQPALSDAGASRAACHHPVHVPVTAPVRLS